jgi:hypothetical protein
MESYAVAAGIVAGAILVVSAAVVWFRKQVFGVGGSLLTVAGLLLLGMSIWSRAKVSVGADGITAEVEQAVRQAADAGAAVAEETTKLAKDVELLRQELSRLAASVQATGKVSPEDADNVVATLKAAPSINPQSLSRASKQLETLRSWKIAKRIQPQN